MRLRSVALLRIHRVVLDDVFLDPLWFNFKNLIVQCNILKTSRGVFRRHVGDLGWLRLGLGIGLDKVCA